MRPVVIGAVQVVARAPTKKERCFVRLRKTGQKEHLTLPRLYALLHYHCVPGFFSNLAPTSRKML